MDKAEVSRRLRDIHQNPDMFCEPAVVQALCELLLDAEDATEELYNATMPIINTWAKCITSSP